MTARFSLASRHRRLAGGAEGDEPGAPGVEVVVREALDRVERNGAVGRERRDERDVDTAQLHRACHRSKGSVRGRCRTSRSSSSRRSSGSVPACCPGCSGSAARSCRRPRSVRSVPRRSPPWRRRSRRSSPARRAVRFGTGATGSCNFHVAVWTAGVGAFAAVGGALLVDEVPGDGHPLMLLTAALIAFSAYRLARAPARTGTTRRHGARGTDRRGSGRRARSESDPHA